MPANSKNINRIKAALLGSFEQVKPILKKLHPYDIAQILEEVSPESRSKIIRLLPSDIASEALSEMEENSEAAQILADISPEVAASLVENLDPDDAADLLAELPKADLRKIMDLLPDEEERVLETLMNYDEESAGGIMNPEVPAISGEATKKAALRTMLNLAEDIEDIYVIYVVDERNRLIGVVSIPKLLRADREAKMKDLVSGKLFYIHVDEDQEEAARIMRQYNIPAVPVVDDDMELLGRITFDDVLDVLEEETTEDMLRIAGVSEDEGLKGTFLAAVKSRIPWLLVNLGTASLAAFVISRFAKTLEANVFIAFFMPVVAGVAGNGATQALAVTIRRIATGGVPDKGMFKIVFKEFTVGLINGILIGGLASLIAMVFGGDPRLGIVVFFALVGNLVIAGTMGSLVPLVLDRLKVDPATASSILITAFTDILGYILLFGLGTLVFL